MTEGPSPPPPIFLLAFLNFTDEDMDAITVLVKRLQVLELHELSNYPKKKFKTFFFNTKYWSIQPAKS